MMRGEFRPRALLHDSISFFKREQSIKRLNQRRGFTGREFDEIPLHSSLYAEVVSNEFNLHETFPALRNMHDVVLGVGLDSVLDMYINSQANGAVILYSSSFVV